MALRCMNGWGKGQSTVEFVVAFPVLLSIAVIAVNVLLFLGDCAAFDRCARQAIRSVAASPGYGQTSTMCAAQVESLLNDSFGEGYQEVSVVVGGGENGLMTYSATLKCFPTLFGMGLKSNVLGVSLPPMTHSVELTIEPYRPGALL